MKSLLTDEIEVLVQQNYWFILNSVEFGFFQITSSTMKPVGYIDNGEGSRKNFIATAKRNGWKKYRFV